LFVVLNNFTFIRQAMKVAQKLVVNYFRAKLNLLSLVSKKRAAEKALDLFCTPMRRPKRKTPTVFNEAERLSFQVDEYTIRGYRWNSNGHKKVLIVHGFESAAKNFERYVTALIGMGFQVLAFDAPAHGESSGKQINVLLYLSTIHKIYEAYGPIDCYITHSYGGLVVSLFLETVPHNKNTRAVLIAPATETVSTIDSFFKFLRLNNRVRKEFDKLIYERSGHWPQHFSVRRAMHNIRAQVLWFHDRNDDLTPVADALRVKDDQHPHVLFRITSGLGHRKIYRDNNVMNEVLDFLSAQRILKRTIHEDL
jgi:pimeloyl-ACP methyl ester carboxylesterase